jgi:hypothetical protein
MKITLLALATIALTADALLTNPIGQKKATIKAPNDINKK